MLACAPRGDARTVRADVAHPGQAGTWNVDHVDDCRDHAFGAVALRPRFRRARVLGRSSRCCAATSSWRRRGTPGTFGFGPNRIVVLVACLGVYSATGRLAPATP